MAKTTKMTLKYWASLSEGSKRRALTCVFPLHKPVVDMLMDEKPADYTPASHSHGNITNDGKVGTAANKPLITGADGVVQAGSFGTAANTFCEGNDSRLSDARTPVAHTHVTADVTDLLNSNFIPSANDAYDLGSASKQWLNTYSKEYYYNGVAWGLDKSNTWTGNQYYTGMMILNSSSDVTEQFRQKLPKDVSTSSDALVRFNTLTDSAGHNVVVETLGHWDTYVAKVLTLKYKNDSTKQGSIEFRLRSDGSGNLYAQSPFACDLGNSYNKWKSFNGVNPGALSLPVTALNNTYDISGNITDLTGGNNSITAARTGWVFVKSDNATEISIENTTTGMGASDHSAAAATLMVSIPVTSGETLNIIANCTSIDKAYLLPCQGNV